MRTFLNGRMIQETTSPGYTIRRELLDQALADAARNAGAAIWLSSRAVSKDGDEVLIRRDGGSQSKHHELPVITLPDNSPNPPFRKGGQGGFLIKLKPIVIIGADGPHSKVGKWIGSANSNLIPAVQVRVLLTRPMEFTEIFFETGIYGGYGWLFPKGDEANVGLGMKHRGGVDRGMGRKLDEFLSLLVKQGKIKGKPLGLTAGWIPAEAPRTITRENILLAGDAAGHTHPITGAGVLQAVIGGRMAGKWASRVVEAGDMSLLAEYESEWSDLFGETLERGFQRRRLLEHEWSRLEEIIKYSWVTFREYHDVSERHNGAGAREVVG
jgi:flavin-dependent dehydrogenase